MHTALVSEWGKPPAYVEVPNPSSPPDSNSVEIKVLAAGLHRLVRSRAEGTHYSSKTLPHIPGTDGVGITTSSGQKTVYFSSFATGGSFSDVVVVPKLAVTELPDGLDPYKTAGLVNPALSSWMALKKRTENLPPGFSVLIMGATSASGEIAISVARAFGAGKVIGSARNAQTLAQLGLDEVIVVQPKIEDTDFSAAGSVDVILDYTYGAPTEHLLRSVVFSKPVQYVHIGSVAGLDLTLPGAVLRSKNLTIRGSGPGAWSHRDMGQELPLLLEAFKSMQLKEVKKVPLSQVEEAWGLTSERMVFVP